MDSGRLTFRSEIHGRTTYHPNSHDPRNMEQKKINIANLTPVRKLSKTRPYLPIHFSIDNPNPVSYSF